jgi:hypothetical protein
MAERRASTQLARAQAAHLSSLATPSARGLGAVARWSLANTRSVPRAAALATAASASAGRGDGARRTRLAGVLGEGAGGTPRGAGGGAAAFGEDKARPVHWPQRPTRLVH